MLGVYLHVIPTRTVHLLAAGCHSLSREPKILKLSQGNVSIEMIYIQEIVNCYEDG